MDVQILHMIDGAKKAEGMTVTELTEEELQAFKDAVADFRNELIDSYGEEACAAFGIVKE